MVRMHVPFVGADICVCRHNIPFCLKQIIVSVVALLRRFYNTFTTINRRRYTLTRAK